MTSVQTELVENLGALRTAIAATAVLRTILDDDWFDTIEKAIKAAASSPADPTGILYDFCHPLRGVDWCERNQTLALAGRLNEVSEDGQFAIALAGLDPLRTMLPVIENRLVAFNALWFKPDVVRVKVNELRAAKFAPAFKNHLFELSVLGDLAMRGVLSISKMVRRVLTESSASTAGTFSSRRRIRSSA
jgi:hypothetical protein